MDPKKILIEENVGGVDLMIRALLGSLAVTLLALDTVNKPWTWILGAISFVGLYTSITKHCGPYALLGFSTKK